MYSGSFTTDEGYASDGSSSYLDTGFVPSALANYSLNSAHVAFFDADIGGQNNDFPVSSENVGSPGIGMSIARSSATQVRATLNTFSGPILSVTGFVKNLILVNRPSSSDVETYTNSVETDSGASGSGSVPDAFNILIGCRQNAGNTQNYWPSTLSMVSVGQGLTDTEALAQSDALSAYLTTVGVIT